MSVLLANTLVMNGINSSPFSLVVAMLNSESSSSDSEPNMPTILLTSRAKRWCGLDVSERRDFLVWKPARWKASAVVSVMSMLVPSNSTLPSDV